MNEQQVLSVDPFEGDRGEPGDRIIVDKIVTCRGGKRCFWCGNKTVSGTKNRVLKAIFDGAFRSYRFCEECCEAMEFSYTDYGQALERRFEIRRENEARAKEGGA